jgi:hypothetical protein
MTATNRTPARTAAGRTHSPTERAITRLTPTANPLRYGFWAQRMIHLTGWDPNRITFSPTGAPPSTSTLMPPADVSSLMAFGGAAAGVAGATGGAIVIDGTVAYGFSEILTTQVYANAFAVACLLPIGFATMWAGRTRRRREHDPREVACPASLVDDVTVAFRNLTDQQARTDTRRGRGARQRALRGPDDRRATDTEPVELLTAAGRDRVRRRTAHRKRPDRLSESRHRQLMSLFISTLEYANQPTPADQTDARDTEVHRRLAIIDRAVAATAKDNNR